MELETQLNASDRNTRTIIGNKIKGFEVNIRLGAMTSACEVTFNYFEKSGDNVSSAIQIGSLNPDVATYLTGIYIIGNYTNLHNVTKEMWSYFIGPSNSNVLNREMVVELNYVNAGNWNDILMMFVMNI
ncbi:hypothetical protein GIX77_00680 [Lactobacillus reuteri]|uniref:Uncharacterized protein n=1 Tax=Limosilactobacillus reuteri TaxID=1598 RepID=A0A7X2KIP4_LIMRT|nr:hypothetical protein [Limosilactobacillus reuteri]MRH71162.1 hypothetical protein [Limosilactobacillus reuteri]MRH79307.1 hypothetical protein [Limosilactobacillus reuteri]